jgi:hypothetical protein
VFLDYSEPAFDDVQPRALIALDFRDLAQDFGVAL